MAKISEAWHSVNTPARVNIFQGFVEVSFNKPFQNKTFRMTPDEARGYYQRFDASWECKEKYVRGLLDNWSKYFEGSATVRSVVVSLLEFGHKANFSYPSEFHTMEYLPKFTPRQLPQNKKDVDKYLQSLKDYLEDSKKLWGDFSAEDIQSNDFGFKVNWGVDMPEYSNVDSCTGIVNSVKINVTYLDETYENEEKEMTSKFKAGDKVVRTEPYVWTFDEGFMQEGKEYIVESITDGGNLVFKGNDNSYVPSRFEFVKSTFQNMKFRVPSPEHSKEIQEALFEMGYTWQFWGREVVIADKGFPASYWLYTDKDGILYRYSNDPSLYSANPDTWQEYTLEITKSYKIIPAETPKEAVTIDGKTYDKEAVLKRLAELEVV